MRFYKLSVVYVDVLLLYAIYSICWGCPALVPAANPLQPLALRHGQLLDLPARTLQGPTAGSSKVAAHLEAP